jgi:hypothetical protein
MLALLIFVVFCRTAHRLITTKITSEEMTEMLDSDGWY